MSAICRWQSPEGVFARSIPVLVRANTYLKDRWSADLNGRQDLRIWMGETA